MSTSRYTNAGDVGVGTVTDNMKSRVKVWQTTGYSGGVPSLQIGFNVASVTDSATGRPFFNNTAPFSTVNCSGAPMAWASTSWSDKSDGISYEAAKHSIYLIEAGGLTDPGFCSSLIFGALA